MEIKLDSKLLKACSGLFMFAISIIFMACDIMKLMDLHWLVGLFLLFSACALGYAFYLDKADKQIAQIACLYAFFAIVFFANKPIMVNYHLFAVWAMLEGAMIGMDGLKLKEEQANMWFVAAGLGALAFLMGFIACFAMGEEFYAKMSKPILVGLGLMFVALAKIFPMCAQFLPKVELNLKK